MTREQALYSLKHETNDRRTICEVWRELWDLVAMLPDDSPLTQPMRDRIIDGFIMGKRMNDRLKQYKEHWDQGFFESATKTTGGAIPQPATYQDR